MVQHPFILDLGQDRFEQQAFEHLVQLLACAAAPRPHEVAFHSVRRDLTWVNIPGRATMQSKSEHMHDTASLADLSLELGREYLLPNLTLNIRPQHGDCTPEISTQENITWICIACHRMAHDDKETTASGLPIKEHH